jgi:hypothetical protein
MTQTVEELLRLKAQTDREIATITETCTKERASQKEEIKAQEDLIRKMRDQCERLKDQSHRKVTASKDQIKALNEKVWTWRAHEIRAISLASLKHVLPKEFTRKKGKEHDSVDSMYSFKEKDVIREEILFQSPVGGIMAFFAKNDRKVNDISYCLRVVRNDSFPWQYRHVLKGLAAHYGRNHSRTIAAKFFPTIAEAEAYHTRNHLKLMSEVQRNITKFVDEVNEATDTFADIMDFRLYFREWLDYNHDGHYRFRIVKTTKGRMDIEICEKDWDASDFTTVGAAVVTVKGFGFEITGVSREKEKDSYGRERSYSDYDMIRLALEQDYNLFPELE